MKCTELFAKRDDYILRSIKSQGHLFHLVVTPKHTSSQRHCCLGWECSVMSNSVWLPWTVARQTPLSWGFSRPENEWITISFSRGWTFMTQGLNPCLLCLLHYRRILHPLSHQGRHYCLGGFGMIFQKAQGHSYMVLPSSYSLPSPHKMITYFYQLSVWQIHCFSLALYLTVPYRVFCVSFLYRYSLPRFKVWG